MTTATPVCKSCGKPVERTSDDSPEVVDFQHVTTEDGVACSAWPVRPKRAEADREVWIVNGRCMDCLRAEDGDPSERDTCGCWCHDTCPDCGRGDCTGEDCYWPDEAGLR